MAKPLNIIFAGTPEFSVAPLAALLDQPHRVVAVYTQPDRPAGRGRQLKPSPVKELAQKHGISVCQPRSLRSEEETQRLALYRADLMVVVAYGQILPASILALPRLGCINIHASLLPRWRGAAPIQRALLAGDRETGITIMEMEEGLDTGPMLLKKSCPIEPHDTAGLLHDRLATLGAEALLEALPGIINSTLPPIVQDESLATYAHKLDKAEALIDWNSDAITLDRQIRAFNPWPVAQTLLDGQALRIWEAQQIEDHTTAPPGEVIAATKEGIDVATGRGILRIYTLQQPGKRSMSATDFINAHRLEGVALG